jgi:serralysin
MIAVEKLEGTPVNVLDRDEVARDDPTIIALHDLLIRAYDDAVEAFAIAGQVGILRADIAVDPKLRFTWWSILEIAAGEGQLRRLVDTALRDPTIAGWHAQIRQVIEVPAGGLMAEGEKARGGRPTTDAQGQGTRTDVGDRVHLWKSGTVLDARFLDGPAKLRDRVEKIARQWFEYTDLKIEFGNVVDAPIRVSFKLDGSWSFMGTNALSIPMTQPTVNFGWVNQDTDPAEVQRVVLHEFGHVVGLHHEQQNPVSDIKWNRRKVYEAFTGPPNHWSRAEVDQQFFGIWSPGYYPVHKVFDPQSIMMFPIPKEWLRSGPEIGWNGSLSGVDKQFAAALYPKRSA